MRTKQPRMQKKCKRGFTPYSDMTGKPHWPESLRKRAREIYISYPGHVSEAMDYTYRALQYEFPKVPHLVTLYRWANKEEWEKARQTNLKAKALDEIAKEAGKPVEQIAPEDFLVFLQGALEKDLKRSEIDQQFIEVFQKRIMEVAKDSGSVKELASALIATSRAADAKLRRASVIGTVLRAIGEAIQARAEVMREGVCPAMSGGPIPEGCPLIRGLLDDNDSTSEGQD